jgi:hypothetical protein
VSLDGSQVLPEEAVRAMQEHVVRVPETLLAEWWGLGPYGKTWDGVEVMGHSGTTNVGSSYLLWAVERDVAIATTVNFARFGYPFAARMFRELFPVAGIAVPEAVRPAEDVVVDPDPLVGRYAMCGLTLTVSHDDSTLMVAGESDTGDFEEIPTSALVPLTPTTFLPTHPAVDGRRGWALAFIGTEDGPASHLLNGVWTLRRIAA